MRGLRRDNRYSAARRKSASDTAVERLAGSECFRIPYLRYRHGISAWDGDFNGYAISMFRAAPMPYCLLHWRDCK
jgi:hypothetical protein